MVVRWADCVVVRNCREWTRNGHKYSVQKLFLENSCILLGIPDHLNVRLRTSIRDIPCEKDNPQKTQNTQN